MATPSTPNSSPDKPTLLAQILNPLLEDFQYWFGRSLSFLEQDAVLGLSLDQREGLVERLRTALAETQTAAALLSATDGQVGVEPSQVMGWHALVAECWVVARRHRAERSQPEEGAA
jgi:hypothetical protein